MATVMIVDDDRNTVKLLQTLLELDGFDVVIAPRGADVLHSASPPQLTPADQHCLLEAKLIGTVSGVFIIIIACILFITKVIQFAGFTEGTTVSVRFPVGEHEEEGQ